MIKQRLAAIRTRAERLQPFIIESYAVLRQLFVSGSDGYLSWYIVFLLAIKNLRAALSRTAVTVFAIAAGTAAIVFLVGFAYGLQEIVTSRLLQPKTLRLTDVQTSSTSVTLDRELLANIAETTGVERVAPAMSLAGVLRFGESRTEIVVLAARNEFLDFSHMQLRAGTFFSQEAEAPAQDPETPDELSLLLDEIGQGQVAGVSTQSAEPELAELVSAQIKTFRVQDDQYVAVRSQPKQTAEIIGYIRGSVLRRLTATEVWGTQYQSTGVAGKTYQKSTGEWLGYWLSLDKPVALLREVLPSVYEPLLDEAGAQTTARGFITEENIVLLTPEEARADALLEKMYQGQGSVLGDATPAAAVETPAQTSITTDTTSATDAAELAAIVAQDQQEHLASEQRSTAVLSVPRQGGKEVLVSSGLLSILDVSDADTILGKTISLEYIISGGLTKGFGGKVISQPTEYTVVGVIADDLQQIVYAPLSELESMGVDKYSLAKVLVSDESQLRQARDRIETLGLSTRSIADTLQQVNRLFTVMRFLLGSFGLIAFVVALFGMFNTLTVSLLERTREIGVMKTFGTTDTDIVKLLFAESTIIGIVGAFLGVFFGVLLGKGVDLFLYFFRADKSLLLFQFPWVFLLWVFLFTVLVGFLTGLYPARRAKHISALDALRYE